MQIEKTRRHGWQFPLHPLQIVGMGVYSFLIVAFYAFLGPFLGNKVVENTVLTLFTFAAFSVIALYIRCTATDPSDKASKKKKRGAKAKGFSKLNYGFILSQMILRFFRRLEKKILRHCIRRRYLDPWKTSIQMEPLLPFPLVVDDSIMPDLKDEDITFCSLCDFEVQKLSKHCRSCNRCVEGFDHHCRWLNNCIGKKNYTTFILLMFFVLLMLLVEGVSAIAIFIRCFANGKGIEKELEHKLNIMLPRGVLAAISAFLTLMTAYSLAALGQLFFFHIVLIRKGMRTYDYILAMKEENQSIELYDDSSSSSSDESIDFKSSEKSTFASRFICNGCKTDKSIRRLSIRVDSESSDPSSPNKKPFRASIDPWKLIKMSKEKALMAAEKARERIAKRAHSTESEPSASLKPMPSETKCGPSMKPEKDSDQASSPSVVSRGWLGSTSRLFSSPRRRVSGSPTAFSGVVPSPKQNYRSNFDLKLTGVSRELETYISRQVLCSVLKKSGEEESPR